MLLSHFFRTFASAKMKLLAHYIPHSELMQNTAKLFSANVVAQAIGLLVYPLLTRLYAPEDFGFLSLFLNIGNILVLLSTMEYQYAVLLAKERRHALAAAQLAALCAVAWTILLFLLLPFKDRFAGWFHIDDDTACLWFLPLFVLAGAGWNILNLYFTRRKYFGAISSYKLSNSLLLTISKVGFGWAGLTSFGLIVATAGASVLSLILSVVIRLRQRCREIWLISWPCLREIAVQYRKFPLFSLPRALVNSLGLALPALILTPVFGLRQMGFLAMAITLSFTPLSLIINSVQQVLFQKVTEKVHHSQSILPSLRRFTLLSLAVMLPAFVLLYWPLPWLSGWLLGEEWIISGEYIRWMLPWLLMVCLNGPICFVADVFMAQGVGLVFECAILLARLAGLLLGIWMHSFEYALMGYIAGSTVVLIAQQIWYYHLVNRYERAR